MTALLTRLLDPLSRLLVAALFLTSGVKKAMDLPGTVGAIAGKLPAEVAMSLALAAIFTEVAGGLALALGARTRLAAAVLAAFTLAATLLFHAFWLLPEGSGRDGQLFQFLKNLAILGALAQFYSHGAGALSIDSRNAPKSRRRRYDPQ